jgi:DNA polymerase elongation subunit (family B)
MSTYTYVASVGNKILSRGYHADGSRFNRKDDFRPTLFTTSKQKHDTKWRDLYGNPVYEVNPGTIKDCRDYIEQYKDVHGFTIMGMTNWVTQYISEEYKGEIKLIPKFNRVNVIDIETTVENGFPNIEEANEEVLLITKYDSIHDRYIVYTASDVELDSQLLIDNKVDPKKVVISKHADEHFLLKHFVIDWANECPDVVTGWNSQLFDIPYLVNRIRRVLGESFVDKLSPWGIVRSRTVFMNNEEHPVYDILGVNTLDYIDLMKKYTYGGRESWKLDNIAADELGMRKLAFDGTFKDHYKKAWNHFVAYNIIDVCLVKMLDDKMKLIDLALTIAYDSKVVPDEVFSQIRSWDSLIYNELKKKNIVIPNTVRNNRDQFEGAYVKDPIIGKHKWVVSFDLASLYPHLMMWANISPETISDYRKNVTVDNLLDRKYDNQDLVEHNVAMAANGVCFRKDFHGFIPELVSRIYDDRSKFKKQMLALEQELEMVREEKKERQKTKNV